MAIKKYTNGSWTPACRKYGTGTDTITTFPATIIGDGTPITSYTIKGNTEQTGTPTPENPIVPSGCGERTENLWDFSVSTKGLLQPNGSPDTNPSYSTSDYIPVTAGQSYTFRALSGYAAGRFVRVAWYDSDKQFVDYLSKTKIASIESVYTNSYTAPNNANYARVSGYSYLDSEFMLVEGSTVPDHYIPYGYKLPLTLGSTTTDIYLGEVQSTRRVKKLVLTGEEIINGMVDANDGAKAVSYTYSELGMTDIINNERAMNDIPYPIYLSSHFKEKTSGYSSWFNINAGEIGANNVQPYATNRYLIFGTSEQTQANFKAYLAAQYAAGTPVTVWYVLAEPETGTLNEPLRKIGDYVDSVSGTGLATSGTGQAFDINTTLKPSEVDLTYHGWHEHEDTKYST